MSASLTAITGILSAPSLAMARRRITPVVVSPAPVVMTLSPAQATPGPVIVKPSHVVMTLTPVAPAAEATVAPAPVVMTLSVARAATSSGYAVYVGVGAASAIDYDSPACNVAPGQASITMAGRSLAAGKLYYLAVRARSDRGVQEANTDRVVGVEIDEAGDLVGPRPNALLASRAEASAGGKIDLTIVYNARGAAGVATAVQVARVTGGVADWESLAGAIPLRSAGVTRRTGTLGPTYDDGETVTWPSGPSRPAARRATSCSSTQ